jgi:hypothetical protein
MVDLQMILDNQQGTSSTVGLRTAQKLMEETTRLSKVKEKAFQEEHPSGD